MKNETDLSKLIRLKKYEHPGDAYFEGFLEEFQRRQRAELLRRSTVSIFMERVAAYVSDFGSPRALATAGAFCLALVGLVLSQRLLPGDGNHATAAEFVAAPAAELPTTPSPARPLPLPEEVIDGPLEIYPVGIQKVGASYYLLQEPPFRTGNLPATDRSTYQLPVIDLTGEAE